MNSSPLTIDAAFLIGVDRSGTSALSGCMEALGFSVGTSTVEDHPTNPLGFFENAAILDFHSAFLLTLASSWHDVRLLDFEKIERNPLEAARSDLRKILNSEFNPKDVPIFKDPRLCTLFPLWRPIINQLYPRYLILHTLRNPQEVANSLHKRNNFSMEKAYMIWISKTLSMLDASRGQTPWFISYSSLIEDPVRTLAPLARKVGILDDEMLRRLLRSRISRDLRHHHSSEGSASGVFERLATQLWMALQPVCRDEANTGCFDMDLLEATKKQYVEKTSSLPEDFSFYREDELITHLSSVVNYANKKIHDLEASIRTKPDRKILQEELYLKQVARLEKLKRALASAEEWQKRSWIHRALHRWRPPESPPARKGLWIKLTNSILKRLRVRS